MSSNNTDNVNVNANVNDNARSKRRFSFARLFVSSPDYLGVASINSNDSSDEHNSVISALQGRRTGTSDGSHSIHTQDIVPGGSDTNQVRRNNSTGNLFPTRAVDLRKVDQRINYMDVDAANYEDASDSSSSYSDNDDAENADMQSKRRLSLGGIEKSLKAIRKGRSLPSLQMAARKPSAARKPRTKETSSSQPAVKQELPQETRKHPSVPMLFMSDESVREEWKHASLEVEAGVPPPSSSSSGKTLKANVAWTAFGRIPWKKVVVLACVPLLAALVSWTLVKFLAMPLVKGIGNTFRNSQETGVASIVPWDNTTAPTSIMTEPTIGMTASAILRRKLVLEHVIEHDLLPQHPTDSDLILTSPTARKAMNWMTGYDAASMQLLDDYHYYHHHETEPIQLGKHYELNLDEIDQKNKILERYIRAAFYFKEHADANIKNTVLD